MSTAWRIQSTVCGPRCAGLAARCLSYLSPMLILIVGQFPSTMRLLGRWESRWSNMRLMGNLGSNSDPEILQARWVLGGISPEQFVELAVHALEHGLDGTALRQLAGLSRPTSTDL